MPRNSHIWDEECARVGAPTVLPFGVSMVAPVLMKYGNEAQKARYLPRILDGTDWWCQELLGAGLRLRSRFAENARRTALGDHYARQRPENLDHVRGNTPT